jgi:hypothetical protein
MTKLDEIRLTELEKGAIVHSKRYKFILSTQEIDYMTMVLTALFKYWDENGRKKFELNQETLRGYINKNFVSSDRNKLCGPVGLKNAMQALCPVFIMVYTKFNTSNGTFYRIYHPTPLLYEWFQRKA